MVLSNGGTFIFNTLGLWWRIIKLGYCCFYLSTELWIHIQIHLYSKTPSEAELCDTDEINTIIILRKHSDSDVEQCRDQSADSGFNLVFEVSGSGSNWSSRPVKSRLIRLRRCGSNSDDKNKTGWQDVCKVKVHASLSQTGVPVLVVQNITLQLWRPEQTENTLHHHMYQQLNTDKNNNTPINMFDLQLIQIKEELYWKTLPLLLYLYLTAAVTGSSAHLLFTFNMI